MEPDQGPTKPEAKSAPPTGRTDKDNEPIADIDIQPAHLNVKRTRPDLVFPVLDPLTQDNYIALFEDKMKICEQMCDFESEEFDVNAKEIKATTLREISSLCDNTDIIPRLPLQRLISVLFLHIFRQKSSLEEKYLFFGDLVSITELAMPHISLAFEILLKVYPVCPTNPLFDSKYLKDILGRFDVPDITERSQIALLLERYIDSNQSQISSIAKTLSAMNMDYLEGKNSPHVLIPSLTVLLYIFQKQPSAFLPLYQSEFLPLLGALHFVSCSRNIKDIIEAVLGVQSNQDLAMPTLHALLTHWPKMTALKEAAFLNLTTFVLTKLTPRQFKEVMRDIFKLYAQASISPHQKVAEAAYSIWNQIQIEPIIMDNSRILFPIIYPPVSKAIREHWSQNVVDILMLIMNSMNRIDSFVFQELCRGKGCHQTDEREDIRTWATIARSAQRYDSKINLAAKLAEIQRTFVKTQAPVLTMANSTRGASFQTSSSQLRPLR